MINSALKRSLAAKSTQQGSVLLISLMLLIVITLLTFTVTETSNIQQKVTGNTRDYMFALQVAEEAALEAQGAVNNLNFTANGGSNGYYYGVDDLVCPAAGTCYMGVVEQADLFDDANWVKSKQATTGVPIPGCSGAASVCNVKGRYIIIFQGLINITLCGEDPLAAITNQYADQQAGAL